MKNAARLRRSSDIEAVRKEGRTIRSASFALRSLPNELNVMRIAVSAPRTLGGSVARNRARRRVREAFRATLAATPSVAGQDVLVTVRPDALTADFSQLRAAATAALASATAR